MKNLSEEIRAKISDQVHDKVDLKIWNQVYDQVCDVVEIQVWEQVRWQVWGHIKDKLK